MPEAELFELELSVLEYCWVPSPAIVFVLYFCVLIAPPDEASSQSSSVCLAAKRREYQ